jgi:hypothetical protein
VHLEVTFAVGEVGAVSATEIKLFPNPTQGNVYFELPNSWGNVAEVRILDLAGRLVVAKTVVGSAMDVSFLPSGTYVVELVGKGTTLHTKFVRN